MGMCVYVDVWMYGCEAVRRLYEGVIPQVWMILFVIKVEKTGRRKEKETNEWIGLMIIKGYNRYFLALWPLNELHKWRRLLLRLGMAATNAGLPSLYEHLICSIAHWVNLLGSNWSTKNDEFTNTEYTTESKRN